jgi:ABC-type transporter Mla subunit MlaD
VNKVVNAVIGYFEMMINGWITATNLFIKILNGMSTALGFLGINLGKLDEIGSVSLGRLDDTAETSAEKAYKLAKSWSEVQSTISAAKPAIDKTTASTDKAGAAAKKTAKETKGLTDAQKALKTALEDAIEAVKDKFSPALAKANDLLTTATDKYNEFHGSISDTVKGLLNLGNAFDTAAENKAAYDEALANKTAADQELSLLTSDRLIYADALEKSRKAQEAFDKVAGKKRSFFDILGDQASKATELSNGIESLISMGLDDPALLQSILSSGADTGLEIIKGILAGGKASVDKLVGLSKTINDAADRIAKLTADKWYKSGIDQAQQIVDGVNSVIANTEWLLKFAVDPASVALIGQQLDTQLGALLGGGSSGGGIITSPTYNPFGPVLGSINAEPNMGGGRVSAASVGASNVTINVNGGDPNAVVSALRSYMRTNGSVPIRVSNIY